MTTATATKTATRKTTAPKAKAATIAKPARPVVRQHGAPLDKPLGIRAQIAADALAGVMPAPLTWTSPSDKRYSGKIEILNAAAAKRDIAALNAVELIPYSSYPNRMIRWRELTIKAIQATAEKKRTRAAK